MIRSKTRLLGVIGDPIEHSLSPIFQNWLLHKIGFDACYVAFHVMPEKLEKAIQGMRALGVLGLNVTVPHKEKVIPYLDELETDVQVLGSANTILNEKGKLKCFNTDIPGFLKSVQDLDTFFKNEKAVILGAGGAAKAVAYALKKLAVRELIVCDLAIADTEAFIRKCLSEFGMDNVKGFAISDARLSEIIQSSSVLINATPVGMAPHKAQSPLPENIHLHKDMLVYDLIYNPSKTRLLQQAQKSGALIRNGLDMLIFQGIASMEIWAHVKINLNCQEINELRSILNKAMGCDE